MQNSATGTLQDNQKKSYVDSPTRNFPNTAQEVVIGERPLIIGIDYDRIDVTYPSNTTELYTYSLAAVTIREILITYLAAVKRDITSVEVVS